MGRFIIEGGHALHGTVRASGMKNAATALLAATLLTEETCVVRNVPKILDVHKMLELLGSLGAEVAWTGDHEVTITARNVDPGRIDQKTVMKLRSSVLLMGPLIARFPHVSLAQPGGCIIGNRPLDAHLEGLAALGVAVAQTPDQLTLTRSRLEPATVVLPEFSVTATENLLMAAALTPGRTVVKIAAAEPHIEDLARFLTAMGARIDGAGTHTVVIEGSKALHGAEHTVIPDQIEIGTWAVAAAVTRGTLAIADVVPEHLDLILRKLKQAGVVFVLEGNTLTVTPSPALHSFRLQTLPYPGFPTDLQAPFAVLATQASGTTLIQDPMYEGRMGYVSELVKMGANAVVCDPHRVVVSGPTPLYGQDIKSFDLRAGATLIIAGLIAQGETIIREAEIVDRGYEAIDERLRSLGAVISRTDHADA